MPQGTFSPDFYLAAATVIPVLFLALTLQGSYYKGLIDRVEQITKKPSLEVTGGQIFSGCLGLLISFWLPSFTSAGEFLSLLALYTRHSNAVEDFVIFGASVGMTLLVTLSAADSFSPSHHRKH